MKLHGIKVPHKKNTADMAPIRMAIPPRVKIPMSMHIGKPAKVIVKKGDKVQVGQLIGEADGFVSSNIHASVSGTVEKVEDMTSSMGMKIPCVVIASDGEQSVHESVKPPEITDFESFVKAVKLSGVVGLGGAGFPSFVKLSVKDLSKVESVVINAAECEPYITSDTRTMMDKTDYIKKGIGALKQYMGLHHFIIGIENNKPDAVVKMKAMADEDPEIDVRVLPSIYPQGGEKVLVFNTVGRIIPKGGLPLDVGVIVINVTTLAFIGEFLESGMPLIEKCVTVDGSAVKEPKNVIAPIGTSIEDLITAAGGFKSDPVKVLYGGPMMGLTVPSLQEPVLKNTNAIIAMDAKEARPLKTTACIGCGACMSHCPFRLDPREISRAYQLDRPEELEKLCVDLCMECGCCSYVCPANRPLVQTNKLAKGKLRQYVMAKKQQEEKGAK